MNDAEISRWQDIYAQSQMVGWDFSRLDGVLKSDDPWWDFDADRLAVMGRSSQMVDLGTCDGERLRSLLDRSEGAGGVVVTTEGWEPNLAVARDRLEPYGVEVRRYDAETGEPLPFDDDGVDLVMSRHEGIDAVQGVRVLAPAGRFLTQQVDGRDAPEIHEWFGEAFVYPHVSAEQYVANLEAEGTRIDVVDEWRGTMEFADVEALVTYLALVPWDAPDFSIEEHASRLRSLGEDLPIRVTQRRFRIYAT